ncbi:MAG: GNAT family N-acetyltransferase, partial [Pseudomonadota bacterium]
PARTFRAALFGNNAFVFRAVADAEDEDRKIQVIGYAISHDSFSTDDGQRGMYLADLFVEEAWRREGAGRALIEAVSKRARQRGATHLWWTSLSQNYQARRFYKRLGATDHPVHAHAIDGPAFDRFSSKRR